MNSKQNFTNWISGKSDTSKYKIINKRKLLLVLIIDKIISIFPRPKIKFSRLENEIPEKILIVRVAYIGDVILSIPAIKSIRAKFPESKIYLLTNPASSELLKKNKDIDEFIPFTPFWFYKGNFIKRFCEYIKILGYLKRQKFDLAVDLRADIRNIFFILFLSKAKYRISYDVGGGNVMLTDIVPYGSLKHKKEFHLDIARYLDCEIIDSLEIVLDDTEKIYSEIKIPRINGSLSLGVHPGARLPLKCYPIKRFSEALNLILKENRIKLYIFCSESEIDIANELKDKLDTKDVEIMKGLSLRELASCISRLNVFICNDSAPMHIASAFEIPTIAIFGPSDSFETGPIGKLSIAVNKKIDCRRSCDENTCFNSKYHECMKLIEPEEIYSSFSSLAAHLKTNENLSFQ